MQALRRPHPCFRYTSPKLFHPAVSLPASVDPQPVRRVEIRPPSARAETLNVLRVAALIVLAAWIYLAAETAPPAAGSAGMAGGGDIAGASRAGRDLMPYQRLFPALSGGEQRMFRELQEGLLEAENGRAATRRWPSPAELAAQGVPPFAAASPAGGYTWTLRQDGLTVNYVGVSAAPRAPAFLLLVQEPDPLAPADAGAPASGNDEMHHRLPDGAILHVSIWMRPAGGTVFPGGVLATPYDRGWLQLLVGGGT